MERAAEPPVSGPGPAPLPAPRVAAACPRPAYARLLGLRAGAEGVLRELSRRAALPIVSDATRLRGDPCFEAEQRFTDLWALGAPESADRRAGQEFTRPFVRVEA